MQTNVDRKTLSTKRMSAMKKEDLSGLRLSRSATLLEDCNQSNHRFQEMESVFQRPWAKRESPKTRPKTETLQLAQDDSFQKLFFSPNAKNIGQHETTSYEIFQLHASN